MKWSSVFVLLTLFLVPPSALADGDAVRGQQLYQDSCGACHSLDANRVGPRHRGVVGRKAGSVDDYRYSPAVRNSKVRWSEQNLDTWLQNPSAFISGTKMPFRLNDAKSRADIIAYLKREGTK